MAFLSSGDLQVNSLVAPGLWRRGEIIFKFAFLCLWHVIRWFGHGKVPMSILILFSIFFKFWAIRLFEKEIIKCQLISKRLFDFLKLTEPLQSCYCPVQKYLPRMAKLAWQLSRYLWRGSVNFKINSRPFLPSFLSSKMIISRLGISVHLLKEF